MKKYYSLRSFWAFLKQYKLRLFLVMSLFAIADLALAFIPVFIGNLIDAASADPLVSEDVWRYVIILVICSSLHDIVWRAAEYSFMRYLLSLPFQYESGLFKQVIQKPYPYFIGKFTGKVASYVTTLRKEFEDLLDKIMWEYVNLVVVAFSMIGIFFSVNATTGIVFLVSILLMIVVGRFTIKNNLKFEAVYTDVDSTKTGKIIDVFGNFVNVKSFTKELSEFRLMLQEQEKALNARKRSFFWGLVFWGSMSIIIRHMIWPVVIIMNVNFFLNGTITIGELTTLLSTIVLFSGAVWEFIWEASQFNLRVARIEESHRYLFGKQVLQIARDDNMQALDESADMHGGVDIQNLTFAYPDQPDQQVLHGVDVAIKKGEKVGIVGHSGSGKTTLVKLLLGYYDYKDGSIEVDGQPITKTRLQSLISYVPQDTTLFNRSIADNISYAVDGQPTSDQIKAASKRALSHDFIAKIPRQYDAIVGERGVKLSTGQRQRIAIARAILQDKPLLILDEATSALDSQNEVLVQQSLENLWETRTVISIAHRLSTLKKMDRIIVFDNGKIVEQGSIPALLKKKGVFYELWNNQINGMIVD